MFRYCLDFSTDLSLLMRKGQLLGIKAEAQRKTFVCKIYLHKFLHSKPQYLHSLGKSLSILFFTVFGKKRFWRYIYIFEGVFFDNNLATTWHTLLSPARPATHMQMVSQKHLHSLLHRKGNVTILQIKNWFIRIFFFIVTHLISDEARKNMSFENPTRYSFLYNTGKNKIPQEWSKETDWEHVRWNLKYHKIKVTLG